MLESQELPVQIWAIAIQHHSKGADPGYPLPSPLSFLETPMAMPKRILFLWLNPFCNSIHTHLLIFTKLGAVSSEIQNKAI